MNVGAAVSAFTFVNSFFSSSHLPDYPEHQDGHVERCHRSGGGASVMSNLRWEEEKSIFPVFLAPPPPRLNTNIPEL